MAKLSKYELHVLSKNYKKFIDNIKKKEKKKQLEIQEQQQNEYFLMCYICSLI